MPVTLERVNFCSREYRRTAAATNSSAETRDILANRLVFQSLLKDESDANALRDSVLALRSPGRKNWTVEIPRELDTTVIGDTICLKTDRFGLVSKNFIVKGKKVDHGQLFNILTLYGPE